MPRTRTNAAARENADEKTLWLSMHRSMLLIRHFEERLRGIAGSGGVPGLVHLCAGQEATNVGVIAALESRDTIASNHRGHGHCLGQRAHQPHLAAAIDHADAPPGERGAHLARQFDVARIGWRGGAAIDREAVHGSSPFGRGRP